MGANTFGHHFQFHSFGESHGSALGCVIDGCPAGLAVDFEFLQNELSRRKPGQSQGQIVSARNEQDQAEILSGVFEGKTLGTPIAVIVRNADARSSDYQDIKNQSRAGHADDIWSEKFGHRDHRGGGRSSGRETVARVIAGAFAKMLLKQLHPDLNIVGFTTKIGNNEISNQEKIKFITAAQKIINAADNYQARFPVEDQEKIRKLLMGAQESGESYGAQAEIRAFNMPKSLGQPVFHKLKSDLAAAVMSIGAVASFQVGTGRPEEMRGTEFHKQAISEVYGGIRGGISTGEDLIIQVKFKPTSSILDVAKKGRHDPCIVTRALPVIEAMVACVIADHCLLKRLDRLDQF